MGRGKNKEFIKALFDSLEDKMEEDIKKIVRDYMKDKLTVTVHVDKSSNMNLSEITVRVKLLLDGEVIDYDSDYFYL
jgi:putative lipoic acid-binding regulatory protein